MMFSRLRPTRFTPWIHQVLLVQLAAIARFTDTSRPKKVYYNIVVNHNSYPSIEYSEWYSSSFSNPISILIGNLQIYLFTYKQRSLVYTLSPLKCMKQNNRSENWTSFSTFEQTWNHSGGYEWVRFYRMKDVENHIELLSEKETSGLPTRRRRNIRE